MSKRTECLAVLGLPPEAEENAIRHAYKDLLQVWHADRFNHSPRLKEMAEAKLKEIDDAYEYLISGAREFSEGGEVEAQTLISTSKEWSQAEEPELQEVDSRSQLAVVIGTACLVVVLIGSGALWWVNRQTAKLQKTTDTKSTAKPSPSISPNPVQPSATSLAGSLPTSTAQVSVPRRLPDAYFKPVLMDTGVVDIAAGYGHALYLKRNQTLWAMRTPFGRAEIPETATYKPVLIVQNIASMSSANLSASLITTENELWEWVRTSHLPFTPGRFDTVLYNKILLVTQGIRQTIEGPTHRLFIDQSGKLWGMGYNSFGQLGQNERDFKKLPLAIEADVKNAAAGKDFTLFIREDNTLWAMGRNDSGQLGDGTLEDRGKPVQIAEKVKSVSAGYSSTVFVTEDGILYGMGLNAGGQLQRIGFSQTLTKPTEMQRDVMAAVAGMRDPNTPFGTDQTLYIKNDRTLWARGNFQQQDLYVDSGVVKVAASMVAPVFLKQDGTMWLIPNLITTNTTETKSTRISSTPITSVARPQTVKVSTQTQARLRVDLICHFKFDGNAMDSSGRGYHGKQVGTSYAPDRFGKPSSAFRFDGERSHVSVDPRVNPQIFTISAWISTDQSLIKEGRAIISKIYSDGSKQHDRRNFEMRLDAGNLIVAEVPDGRNWNHIHHRQQFVPQTWHQIVMTHDGSLSCLYIDGQKVSNELKGDYVSSPSIVLIGARPLGEGRKNFFFNGHIDDVRIYTRALSSSEVQSLYWMESSGD